MDEDLKKKEEENIPTQDTPSSESEYVPSGQDPDSDPETEPYKTNESASFAPLPPRKRNWKKLIYLLGAILIIVVLFNVFRTITGGSKAPEPTPTPIVEETPEPTLEEEPTPEPTSSIDSATGLDRAELNVTVQNGSGEAGVAKKAGDLLKDLGYNVVSTGNADNYEYTDVTVRVKSTEKKYLPLLIKDLSGTYTIGASSSDLSASESAEAVVIVGK